MIFKDIIQSKGKEFQPIFDKLFELALTNQNHPGDLLLVSENGFFNPEVLTWRTTDVKYLPYSIGQGKEGRSENIHYKFIESYRTAECKFLFDEYLNEIKWDDSKRELIEKYVFQEELSIQLEMLIYLKIWEADAFIKRFYQLARLINKQDYDWHFRISESNRDKTATGTRQEILKKKIRNEFETQIPEIYNSFKKIYIVQLRNSIAHSQYSFLSRYIHLNNKVDNDKHSQLTSILFNDWIDIFHETLIIHNEYVRLLNKINSHYAAIAQNNNNQIEVIIRMKYPEEKDENIILEYRPEWDDFKIKKSR